jgi:Zn-finger protein
MTARISQSHEFLGRREDSKFYPCNFVNEKSHGNKGEAKKKEH